MDRSGTGRGATRSVRSQRSCSGARLVTSSASPGHAASKSARWAAAGNTCSKLSSTSNWRRSRKASTRRSSQLRRPMFRRLRALARALRTCAGSRTGVRSAKATPSAKRSGPAASEAAAASARRVLPTPAGPVNVSSRTSSVVSSCRMSASSSDRPTSGVGGDAARRASVTRASREVAAHSPARTSWALTRARAAASNWARASPSNPSALASNSTVALRGMRRLPCSSAAMVFGLRPALAASCS